MFLGICGGLAQFGKVDATAIRLIVVFLWVLTGFLPLLFTYLIAALFIPLEPGGIPTTPKRRLFRSQTDRKIAGVCGGLAQLFQIDSTLVRVIAIFLCALTGVFPFLLAYLLAWILIPLR